MYGKKIKYFRIKNNLTSEELARKLSCTKSAISQYENDKRDPDENTLKKIADIFDIPWTKLLSNNTTDLKFKHFSFRKKMSVSKNEIEVLKNEVEAKCKDRIDILTILDDIPKKPFQIKKLSLDTSVEENALCIRRAMGISIQGPIYSITSILETLGVIVLTFDCIDEIEGLNGYVNNIPYIFFNSNKTIERQRFTLIHEFCHLFFNHLDIEEKTLEKYINKLTGNVLISNSDIYSIFGRVNRNITTYIRNSIAKEYKIAPSCLIKRLNDAGVITDSYYTKFYKILNSTTGKKNERSLLTNFDSEVPTKFNHQVYLALSEELITASKASELLNIPLMQIISNMGV